uniref:Putative ovule protein n=1 Tax=Solanum chacoense TaxID=4108 RepID=A0A0V0I7L9_SOLCH
MCSSDICSICSEREVQLIVASVNESDKGSQNIFLNSCFLSHYYMKEQLLHLRTSWKSNFQFLELAFNSWILAHY